MLVGNDSDTTKNPKLVPNWKGTAKIIDINDTNAKVKLRNKIKVLNVSKLKHFFQSEDILNEGEDNTPKDAFNNHTEMLKDIFNEHSDERPVTRVGAKLIEYRDMTNWHSQ